jgi:outer membrane protein assembly factor BamB
VSGTENGKIRSFDMAKGNVRWTVPTRDVVRSRAAVAGDRIFVGSLDGFVYGIRSKGSRQTRLDLGAAISGAASVHNGFLYAANVDGELAAFDVSGKRSFAWWTRRFDGEVVVHVSSNDTHLFAVTDKSNIHAFAADKR